MTRRLVARGDLGQESLRLVRRFLVVGLDVQGELGGLLVSEPVDFPVMGLGTFNQANGIHLNTVHRYGTRPKVGAYEKL